MRERDLFRAGMRICGVGLLAWFLVDGAEAVAVLWNLGKLIYAGIVYGSVPLEVVGKLAVRAAGFLLRGLVGWYLLFGGKRLLNRVYPEPVAATPPTTA